MGRNPAGRRRVKARRKARPRGPYPTSDHLSSLICSPTTINGFAKWLGYGGEILVLFETPSGFACFNYNGVKLYTPNAMENIWSDFAKDYVAQEVVRLKEFQFFENKTAAITRHKGVHNDLRWMIKTWLRPGQKLAVGKSEYKQIIEEKLQVSCLFDEAVMELMWGLQNLMKSLVPDETNELAEEDRLPMSQGMEMFLKHYDLYLTPETADKRVIEAAYALYECLCCEKRHEESLKQSATVLKEVSGIDIKDWNSLKTVCALRIICYPEEEFEYDEVFSLAELSQLLAEAPKFDGKLYKKKCLAVYNVIIRANKVRFTALEWLKPRLSRLNHGDPTAETPQVAFDGGDGGTAAPHKILELIDTPAGSVKSGTLFDNIVETDDPEYAKKLAEETWGKQKDAEKAPFDEAEEKRFDEAAFDEVELVHTMSKQRLDEESASSKDDENDDLDVYDEDEAFDDNADHTDTDDAVDSEDVKRAKVRTFASRILRTN